MKKLLTLWLVIITMAAFAQGNKITSINPNAGNGSRSLTGSYVAFDPSMGGEPGYAPGGSQDLIFRTESFTPDYEYVYHLWLKFPAGWIVNSVSIFGTPVCTGSGTLGTFSFSIMTPPNTVDIGHPRYQSSIDHCTVYYLVNVTAPETDGNAEVSWYWDGDGYGGVPHNPCSDDGYTPDGQNPCDEMINPPAVVPYYFASLDCSNNALFSQPPINANNAYFSDESTYWLDQRIYENFSGLVDPIGGVTFWGIMWDVSDCYSPGPENFDVTFYQDNSGSVGSPVQSFSFSVTPVLTNGSVVGAVLLRYDLTLPSSVTLTSGWIMVYRENPQDSNCAFAWARTDNGDDLTGFNQYDGPMNYQADNVSFCLTGVNELVPLSNWALFIALGLILGAAVIRFRRLL